MKKKIEIVIRICIAILLVLSVSGYFYYFYSPIKDGLYFKYQTTVKDYPSLPDTIHKIRFVKKSGDKYQVTVDGQGLFKADKTFIVNKYFVAKDKLPMAGPTAAVLWVKPYSMRIGAKLIPGEVIKFTKWQGYSVAVIKDTVLVDCYGFYDRKTGIQVGYHNCCMPQKIITRLVVSNLKGL
jgi:hypothetical protein